MGILTSMFTAVSGLSAYGNAMGIIGNNIANVGTAGFKGSRPAFADLISTSLAGASGTDQAGLGVYLADVQGVFTQGSLTTTGQVLDMAIDGTGFFLLTDPVGTEFYSRNGQFKLDSQGRIVDSNNYLVQGYQANAAGVLTGTIGNITLTNTNIAPSGTSTVNITANLNAASTAPAGAFNATDPTTYNFSSSTTVFDSLGNTHNLQFFFVKSGVANTWNVYQRLDTGAAAAATNLVFNSSGALTSGGAQNFSLAIAGGATTPCRRRRLYRRDAVCGAIGAAGPGAEWIYFRDARPVRDRFAGTSDGAVYERAHTAPGASGSEPIPESARPSAPGR